MKAINYRKSFGENQWLYGTPEVGAGVKLDLHWLYINPEIFFIKSLPFLYALWFFSHKIWGQIKTQYNYVKVLIA